MLDQVQQRTGGRSARVREAVLRATVEVVAESGYAGLSFEEVARRSGVHKTTVYRRWPTTAALVLDALLERSAEAVPVPDTGSVREDLRRFVRAIASNVTSPLGAALVATLTGEPADETVDALVHDFWRARFALAAEIVQRGIDRGELRADVDAGLVVELLVAPLYLRLLVTREPVNRRYADRVVDLAVAGCANTRATPQV